MGYYTVVGAQIGQLFALNDPHQQYKYNVCSVSEKYISERLLVKFKLELEVFENQQRR
jgi:hypothetical protein